MGVVHMRIAAARLRKLPRRCRMCGGSTHSTRQHLKKAIASRGPRTEEHSRKLGLAHKGKPSWNKGIKGSIPGRSSNPRIEAERRRKISEHHKGREQPWCTGRNHYRWKGTDYSKENADFRRLRPLVLERDKNICQQCGKTRKQVRLVVHHIDHDHQNSCLDNLIVLCHPDNVRAEALKYKEEWEKKFRKYTKKIIYKAGD